MPLMKKFCNVGAKDNLLPDFPIDLSQFSACRCKVILHFKIQAADNLK
jgi:hypothetical protein